MLTRGWTILIVLFCVVCVIALFAEVRQPQISTPLQSARYQIVINPSMRRDTFLLDTQTGKVWKPAEYVDMVGNPEVWEPMDRPENQEQLYRWVASQTAKPAAKQGSGIVPPN